MGWYMETTRDKVRQIDTRVRGLMEKKKWSEDDLCKRLISLGYEANQYKVRGWIDPWMSVEYPELCDIVALADVFGVSADYLLGRTRSMVVAS